MGGKYEVIGWEYPYHDENDIHIYTNSWIKARKAYRKAKKCFTVLLSSGTIRT